MELQTLKVRPRVTGRKSVVRRVRIGGFVPAVLYGEGGESVAIEAESRAFDKVIHGRGGEHALVKLEVEGKPEWNSPAQLRFVDHHPLKGTPQHADFQRISLDRRIRTIIPVNLVGKSEGVVMGGVLDKMLHEIEVECLALEVPENITVDVTALKIGDNIHVSQLTAPPNVSIVTDGDRTVATVHSPRVEEEKPAEVAAEGVAAEGAAPAAGEAGKAPAAAAAGKGAAAAAGAGKAPTAAPAKAAAPAKGAAPQKGK